mmetsp:Transcript_11361/g.21688  ORF Transcript_11361/g.21688 Transcript_11361/m.21688 type:complete len:353 (-) Transcript_11361:133-1191(-)
MDCLCCHDGGKGPDSDTEFLGSICNLRQTPDGAPAVFPVEPDRYTLYLIAGCPFAARPWIVASFYGLCCENGNNKEGIIKVCKCFPAAHDDGWFFTPVSEGEKELVKAFPGAAVDADPNGYENLTHVRQLYEKAKPGFAGAISVPLLWDAKQDTAVSNSSLGLSEMMATQMRVKATRHADHLLFPEDPVAHQEHAELVKKIHSQVTTPVYKINATTAGVEHDKLVDDYYAVLDEFEARLGGKQPYLMGDQVRFADFVLFISLVRLDLAYQWRFGLGKKSVRENYPHLWDYQKRILQIPGVAETVLPRDTMALYFLTPKWVKACAGRMSLPQVPLAWETGCRMNGSGGGGCMF